MKALQRVLFASVLLIWIALLCTPAQAKDVCLKDNFNDFYVFSKAKLPKAGKTVPLSGMYIQSPHQGQPFAGSATRDKSGAAMRVGIFVQSMIVSNNITVEWTATPSTWAGAGVFDNTGDYNSDGAMVLTAVNCNTVVIP